MAAMATSNMRSARSTLPCAALSRGISIVVVKILRDSDCQSLYSFELALSLRNCASANSVIVPAATESTA